MFWLVTAAVVVLVVALSWWSSGRSKPLGRRVRDRGAFDSDQQAMQQMQQSRMGPPFMGPGGS